MSILLELETLQETPEYHLVKSSAGIGITDFS